MSKPDIYGMIGKAEDRFEAAILIRALAAHHASVLRCYSIKARIHLVEEAELLAESLERDYCLGDPDCDDCNVPESDHPWRTWLKEKGYISNGGK